MRTKKIIIPVILLFILGAIIYVIFKFKNSDKQVADYVVPELKLAQMQVTNLTAEKVDLEMNLLIDNPAPVGFSLDSLFYTVMIEGNEVARTTYPDSLRLEARDSTTVELPLTLYHDKLADVLASLEQQGRDSVMYTLNATIFSDMALIPKDKLNFKIQKRWPLFRILEAKVTDINLDDFGLKGGTVQLEAAVTNNNAFPIQFSDLNYRVQLDNNGWMEGSKPGLVSIPAKGSTTLTIPVEIGLKQMGKNALDLLRKGSDIHYDFRMNSNLASNAHVLQDSKMALSASGKLKPVIKAAKEHAKD
jgi:LEA14-like dessication related protein